MPNHIGDIHGLGVLITRPIHQAHGLVQLIQAYGGRPVLLPAMAIESIATPQSAVALLRQTWDLTIYTSANAVSFAYELLASIPSNNGIDTLNKPLIAAIGNATAATIRTILGREPDLVPNRHDSEGLLELPELNNPCNWRILIIRGIGGRGLLSEILTKRGATVAIAEVYQRSIPQIDTSGLVSTWDQQIQVVTVTSGEILQNLWQLLGNEGQNKLLHTPLIVISQRLQQQALSLGFQSIRVAKGASDQAILTALQYI